KFKVSGGPSMGASLSLAYVLIVVGLLLLVAELFLPSSGILLVVSLCAIAFGVTMTFIYGEDPITGVITLTCVLIALPLLGGLLLHYWPKPPLGRTYSLNEPDEEATITSIPVNDEPE